MTGITSEEIRIKAAAAAEAMYRLSGVPSFDPALKFELRSNAAKILTAVAALALSSKTGRQKSAENLWAVVSGIRELIRFAREMQYITSGNAGRVLTAYQHIEEFAAAIISENSDEVLSKNPPEEINGNFSDRQRRIISHLAANGKAQISDIREIFGSECSEKTLQRDLWQLVNLDIIRRVGDNRWTTYIYIGH